MCQFVEMQPGAAELLFEQPRIGVRDVTDRVVAVLNQLRLSFWSGAPESGNRQRRKPGDGVRQWHDLKPARF